MGRGLSDLQKTILRLAYENHVSEGRSLPRYEVCVDVEIPPPPERAPLPEDPMQVLLDAFHTDDRSYWAAYDKLKWQARKAVASPIRDLISAPLRVDGASNAIIAGVFATEDLARSHAERINARGATTHIKAILDDGADLYPHEVLIAAFGFGEYRRIEITGKPASLRGCADNSRLAGGKYFDRTKIGEERYNTAVVSVSRAFARLEERGLVIRVYAGREWMGIDLTPEGLDTAKRLSANTLVHHTTVSQ